MNLVQRIDVLNSQTADVLEKYKDVFEGLGHITKVTHHISLHQGSKPVVHPPRRVPVTLRPKVRQELARMEKLNVRESA